MSRKTKWLLIIGALVAGCLFLVFRTYYGIHAELWQENRQIVQAVYDDPDHPIMVKTTRVETFIGEDKIKIVRGEDAEGRSIIVWMGEQHQYAAYEDEGVSEAELTVNWQQSDPDKKLLRIMPGYVNNRYVWEIFYKKQVDGKELYYYDYYQFADGSHVATYLLTLK